MKIKQIPHNYSIRNHRFPSNVAENHDWIVNEIILNCIPVFRQLFVSILALAEQRNLLFLLTGPGKVPGGQCSLKLLSMVRSSDGREIFALPTL